MKKERKKEKSGSAIRLIGLSATVKRRSGKQKIVQFNQKSVTRNGR
jgi:hypothetical protein